MTTTKSLAAKPSGLDLGGLGDLASMLATPAGAQGTPQMFDMDKIREDRNVRSEVNPGFGKVPMEELTAEVRERGIKSPLSLRPDPDRPGHYIINFGHRRYRAAKAAGLKQVPGFVDKDFNRFDQVKENAQREGLTAREYADFIGEKLAEGMTQTEIAKGLNKSKAFVSQHAALLNLPEPIAEAFQAGNVSDLTLLNELVRAHRENPEQVKEALASTGEESLAAKQITRETVKALRKPALKVVGNDVNVKDTDSKLRSLEQAVSDHLETAVSIYRNGKGKKVQLTIIAQDGEHLNDLLTHMGMSALIDTGV